MSNTAPDEGNHADDIVELTAYEAPMPIAAKGNFLPWHHPRKQYVRHHQWCHEVIKLVVDRPPTDGTLKYLGLPGVDLLDLRHFHAAVCEARGVNLRFLGFNSSAQPRSSAHTELNIALDEVMRLPRIDPLSYVIGDNFARIANHRSIAFTKARDLGPYDVINLDLCDGFGAQAPGTLDNSYYDAVTTLLSLQARTKTPWLLMLTTRADRPNINDQVLEALIGKYLANLNSYTSFREASRDHFAIETEATLTAATGTPDGLLQVFLTGLCKWFATLALEHSPPTSVELLSAFGYRVDRGSAHEDLISLALKFTPTFTPVRDALGLANPPKVDLDEGAMATKALRRVARRIDADKKLAENAELYQQMIAASTHLLSLARYDIEAYKAWVQAA